MVDEFDLSTRDVQCGFYVSECQTCKAPIVRAWDEGDQFEEFTELNPTWPSPARLDFSVPSRIRRRYEEGCNVKNASPSSFVVLIGKALEAMCTDKEAAGKDLATKLRNLAERGIIPEVLTDVSHEIRLLRNASAHDGEEDDVTAADAESIDQLFRALMEYVYVAPDLLRDFQAKRVNAASRKGARKAKPGIVS